MRYRLAPRLYVPPFALGLTWIALELRFDCAWITSRPASVCCPSCFQGTWPADSTVFRKRGRHPGAASAIHRGGECSGRTVCQYGVVPGLRASIVGENGLDPCPTPKIIPVLMFCLHVGSAVLIGHIGLLRLAAAILNLHDTQSQI